MTPDDDKQLSFDFMNEPKQLSPKAEYQRTCALSAISHLT